MFIKYFCISLRRILRCEGAANIVGMNEITEIISGNRAIQSVIDDLKQKSITIPSWEKIKIDYEPTLHAITKDTDTLRDKRRSDGVLEKSARITVGLEKMLVNRITEFTCAIPIKRYYSNIEDNEEKKNIVTALEAIYKYAHIDSENIKRLRAYYAGCECFTIWYTVKKPNRLYGFDSKYKLKCKTYSPIDGVKLYPLIDETDDMIAMSFEYEKKVNVRREGEIEVDTYTFFETYTADKHYKWVNKGHEWEPVIDGEEIIIMKIPGAYIWRSAPIFDGLTVLREEIEYALSRNSNVVAYNSAPIIKVSGEVKGTEEKGESRRIWRVTNGGDVSYVSWAQSTAALEYDVSNMIKLFFMQAQIPDVSFDAMKSLGNIGYDARMTLFTDAHLKIGDESGPIVEFLEREEHVIKAFLKKMNVTWESLVDEVEVEHTITPYVHNDEGTRIQRAMQANGGGAIMSLRESIEYANMTSDVDATLEAIKQDKKDATEAQLAAQAGMMNNVFG